jgi:hypothetical protein
LVEGDNPARKLADHCLEFVVSNLVQTAVPPKQVASRRTSGFIIGPVANIFLLSPSPRVAMAIPLSLRQSSVIAAVFDFSMDVLGPKARYPSSLYPVIH